jgi:hypothetical protein
MKKVIALNLFALLFLILAAPVLAQSDYEMVQSFKERYQHIVEGIKTATSLDELNTFSAEIANLKRDFEAKKEILDQSLYPENFTSSIEKLSAAEILRRLWGFKQKLPV